MRYLRKKNTACQAKLGRLVLDTLNVVAWRSNQSIHLRNLDLPSLERRDTRLASANPDGGTNICNENLAVTDLTGLSFGDDC